MQYIPSNNNNSFREKRKRYKAREKFNAVIKLQLKPVSTDNILLYNEQSV